MSGIVSSQASNASSFDRRQASLLKQFEPQDSTVALQHSVEWFSGDSLNAIWSTTTEGSGTVAMSDAIDDGLILTSGTVSGDATSIHFNDIRHYSNTGCVIVFVIRGNNRDGRWQLANALAEEGALQLIMLQHGNGSTFRFFTAGTSFTNTSTGITNDTNPHTVIMELTSTTGTCVFDGKLTNTATTNLPTLKLQPEVLTRFESTDASNCRVTYLEAYNT